MLLLLLLENEFGAFESQITNSLVRIEKAQEELLYLAQGGTAVGTGLNSSKDFTNGFLKALEKMTGIKFKKVKITLNLYPLMNQYLIFLVQ